MLKTTVVYSQALDCSKLRTERYETSDQTRSVQEPEYRQESTPTWGSRRDTFN